MKCEFCNTQCEPQVKIPCCRDCWYDGAIIARNLAGAINVLDEAVRRHGRPMYRPDAPLWSADHTGGGCFALRLLLSVQPPDSCPAQLMLTGFEGPVSGGATLADFEEHGWLLGAYRTDEEYNLWPHSGERGLGTEQVPMLIGKAIDWVFELA